MDLFTKLDEQLGKLKNVLFLLNDHQYTYACTFLSNASIGGHTRHVIELLNCAIAGYGHGLIDYENRSRDLRLETSLSFAKKSIEHTASLAVRDDKGLFIITTDHKQIPTTYYRELQYNVDHIIHHLALIKVALLEIKVELADDQFGVAYSTISYQQSIQQ